MKPDQMKNDWFSHVRMLPSTDVAFPLYTATDRRWMRYSQTWPPPTQR